MVLPAGFRPYRYEVRSCPCLPRFASTSNASQIALRLIATTDVHVHIHPHDYYADRPAPGTGLAHAAAVIARLRAEAPNALLFDNGDILQGTPMADYVAEIGGTALPHPAIAAMNTMGYDAATLGNHEFNYGLDFLLKALAEARFPLTSANVVTRMADDPAQDDTLLPPFLVLPRPLSDGAGRIHDLRIGVIGVVPPQIMTWDSTHLRGQVSARDILVAVRSRLPQIRAAGADIVVALCHSGIGPDQPLHEMENAATALAGLEGIDAIIAGHSHLVFPSPQFPALPGSDGEKGLLQGKPAVMPGCHASHLGVIDLVLERTGPGWRVAQSVSRALSLEGEAVDTKDPHSLAVLEATKADHLATLDHIRQPAGESDIPLHTFFAALPGNAALDLISRAQAWHVARELAGGPYADLPLLSAASPFKMGGRGGPGNYTDVPPGPLALRHVADLYPYPNRISAVLVTGAQLRDWLERAAGIFRTIQPGQPDQLLIDPTEPSSQFDVIAGVTWAIDLTCPPLHRDGRAVGGRIRDLRYKGRPVAETDRFVIATNSHRAEGSDAFPGTGPAAVIHRGRSLNRDVLLAFLGATGPVRAPGASPWRFVPLPGTTVLYETSPRAAAHAAALSPLRVEPAGEAPGGFARFRIHL